MKIALVGIGKTGGEVLKLLSPAEVVGPFEEKNPPTLEALRSADCSVVFVPGESLNKLLPLLIEARKPAVIGSTGWQVPADLNDTLKRQGTPWVVASNFSLGMNLIFALTQIFAATKKIFPEADFHIHEAHHIHKKDKPSGTALTLQRILRENGVGCEITADREGDIVGLHTLTISTGTEKMSFTHEAQDRKIFAEGALWAARELIGNDQLKPGFHRFEDCMQEYLGVV